MQDEVQHISEAQAVYLEKFLNYSGTIIQLAAEMDVPLVDMIDTLSSPEVLDRIQNTKLLTDLKLEILAAKAEMAALETLQEITTNKAHDPVERRRAAGAILRATRSIRSRARSRSRTPGAPPVPDSNPCGTGISLVPDSQSRSPSVPPDLNSSPNQNRACQEAAAGHQSQSCINSNTTTPDQQSPPPPPHDLPQLMPPLELAIFLGEEDNPNNIDPPLQGSTTPNDSPQGVAVGSGCNAPSARQDQEQPDRTIEAQSTQPQTAPNNDVDPQTPSRQHPKSPPSSVHSPKDNPWEGHPFQVAGNKAFGRSNHDPP